MYTEDTYSYNQGCVTGFKDVNASTALRNIMTVSAQQHVSVVVVRTDSVRFQLYSGGDMQF